MLEEITPSQFAEWIAALNLGIDPDEWHRTGSIAETIHNSVWQAVYSFSTKTMPSSLYQLPSTYDPYAAKKKKRYDLDSIKRSAIEMRRYK